MTKLVIEIDIDNPVFHRYPGVAVGEIARILARITDRLGHGDIRFTLDDANGNTLARISHQ